jgi:hypothetical protein
MKGFVSVCALVLSGSVGAAGVGVSCSGGLFDGRQCIEKLVGVFDRIFGSKYKAFWRQD